MGCNCGKKNAKAKSRLVAPRTASATPAKPVPTRPATWNGTPKKTST